MTRFLTLFSSIFMTASITFAQVDRINSGNPARPFGENKYYAYGIVPSNALSADAASAYNYWVQDFVEDCGDGSKRVKFDQVANTVSEGIAYGMLLSAYAGDKETFDGLWKYYNANVNGKGVMNWEIAGCSHQPTSRGRNAATDAELDAAMALLVASKQWNDATDTYAADALALIQKIKQYEMTSFGDTKPGDSWSSHRNPSYYSPAYYREYAKVDTDNSTFWNISAVEIAETHLLKNRHAVTGLVSDWSDPGTAEPKVRYNAARDLAFSYDAVRNPWRMATDYVWNGPYITIAANDICTKIGAFMLGKENNIRITMNLNGTAVSGDAWANGASYMTSLAAMGTTNQESLNTLYTKTKTLNGRISNNPERSEYFNTTIRCITLFMMTGNFWNPADDAIRTEPNTEVATAINFTKNEITLVAGESEQVPMIITPLYTIVPNAVWSSSDESIASISTNGVVTALAEGEAIIRLTSQTNPTLTSAYTVTVENPNVAIDCVESQKPAIIYPSPVQNELNIETAQQMQTIQIFNTLGVNVLSIPAHSQHETIDVSNLARGIYFVHIEFTNGQVEKSQFVKQ